MSLDEPCNRYSAAWSETFLTAIDPAQTAREVAFLRRQVPPPRYRRVLDICCGAGRHAVALANAGYDVVGIERDPALIEIARAANSSARFVTMDMRDLGELDQTFDAAICMWASFGYFDSAANDAILRSIGSKLGVGGRFILDIYNADFFASRQGTRESIVHGRKVIEAKRVQDGRLHVDLVYDDGAASDAFEWELFTPESIGDRAAHAGLSMVGACTNFDESQRPSDASARMQLTFESADRNGR